MYEHPVSLVEPKISTRDQVHVALHHEARAGRPGVATECDAET